MKTTGIIRNLDELGRITLPIEFRRSLNVNERDPIEISMEAGQIILKKHESCDIFTGAATNLIEYYGKKVSKESIIEMAKLAGLKVE